MGFLLWDVGIDLISLGDIDQEATWEASKDQLRGSGYLCRSLSAESMK